MKLGVVSILCFIIARASCHGDVHMESPHTYRKTISDKVDEDTSGEYSKMDVLMPGAYPQQEDQYLCSAFRLPEGENYITSYEPVAQGNMVHHLLLYGCETPQEESGIWPCASMCGSGEGAKIMFAWARNAPEAKLPPDVGYKVGGDTSINYVILQLHYRFPAQDNEKDRSGLRLTLTAKKQHYMQGILLLVTGGLPLQPYQQKINVDISCRYEGQTEIFPIGFRTHAHTLARVITGYIYNSSYFRIGKGNPAWPQAFYPAEKGISIKNGDYLVGRCSYNTSSRSVATSFGSTHNDEMCNFYIMFYTDGNKGVPFVSCNGNQYSQISADMPADSDVPPPRNAALEQAGDGHVHNAGPQIEVEVNWPTNQTLKNLGQVSAVAVDTKGQVYLFHRGARVWDGMSFDSMNKFAKLEDGPIKEETILVLDSSTGTVISKHCANMFFMPHGLNIDYNDNIWLTDVAMHQIMRLPRGAMTPDLVLGEKLVPGSDNTHFCKPTDVAVLSTGEFFVADGYCNQRIMKFSAEGKLLMTWGTASNSVERDGHPPLGTFSIPHSIVNVESKHWICVADRENGRVQCFDYNGKAMVQINSPLIGGRLFAVTHCSHTGMLYALNGPSLYQGKSVAVVGFTMDPNAANVVSTWAPPAGFSNPHDVTGSYDGTSLYIAEIGPNRVWKFNIKGDPTDQSHVGHADPNAMMHHNHSVVVMDTAMKDKSANSTASDRDMTLTLVVGSIVAVPLVIVIVVVACLRMRRCLAQQGRNRLDLGRLFSGGKPRGFESVRTTDDKEDLDQIQTDSETEEFSNASLLRKA